MPTEIKMPQLGESVHEGTVGRWLKRPGDAVAKYEPLVEVITDKVNVEMPSPFAGVLRKILVEEGATVVVGTPIAEIEERAGASASAGPSAAPAAAGTTPAGAVGGASGNRLRWIPRASCISRSRRCFSSSSRCKRAFSSASAMWTERAFKNSSSSLANSPVSLLMSCRMPTVSPVRLRMGMQSKVRVRYLNFSSKLRSNWAQE